jgi:hypothetical protein
MGFRQYAKNRWERDRFTLLFMALGLAMVAAAEPLRTELLKHLARGSRLIVWIEPLAYTFEHLGAVLFVATLLRIWIEERAQERANRLAVEEVKNAMKEKLDVAFRTVDEKVNQFNTTVDKLSHEVGTGVAEALQSFNEKVLDVNQKMESLQTVLGGNLYGRRLDQADRTEIGKVYLNPEFFRPLYRLELKLKLLQDDIIEVGIETDALIENISKDKANHTVSARLDNVLFKSRARSVKTESKMIRFEYGPNTVAGRQQASLQALNFDSCTPDELKKLLREDGTDLIFEYPFGIPIPPNETYFMKVVASQFMREGDLFVWKMFVATQKLEIVVHLADGLTADSFLVVARPVHHRAHPNFGPALKENGQRLEWTIDGVLLPYQGVELWWSRRDPPAQA